MCHKICFKINEVDLKYVNITPAPFLSFAAPVKKVNIQRAENIITCSSEGIYPKPELAWSTSPSSKNTTVQLTEQLLYNISSSLIVSHSETDQDYSCTISTRRNRRRATLFKRGKHVQAL